MEFDMASGGLRTISGNWQWRVHLPMQEPRPRVICDEADRNITSWVSDTDDISPDGIFVVVWSIRSCASYNAESML